jgi:small-conductance mechanosensitive channel
MNQKTLRTNIDEFRAHVKKRNWLLLTTGAVLAVIATLNWVLQRYEYGFAPAVQTTTETVLFAIATLFVATTANRLLVPWIKRLTEKAEPENQILVSKSIGLFIFSLATVVILWRFGVDGQNIALVLGFLTTGFALSVRDIIASYLAWFVLLTKRPFRIGDTVRIDGSEGEVKHIGTFYVVLDENPTNDEDFYKIPTVHFIQKPLRNFQQHACQDTLTVEIQRTKGWKETLNELEAALEELETPTKLGLDVEEKAFVAKVAFTYTLRNKSSVKNAVTQTVLRVLSEEPGVLDAS